MHQESFIGMAMYQLPPARLLACATHATSFLEASIHRSNLTGPSTFVYFLYISFLGIANFK
jgi:hypothetical protein